MTKVKICCIGSPAEAGQALRLGAAAIGLVSEMPSGPGVIPEELIAEIAPTVPPPAYSFLLTSLTEPEEIIAQHGRCGTSCIQLVDRLAEGALAELKAGLPEVLLVQVVHVAGEESVSEAREAVRQGADKLLLDSGNTKLTVRELGGTGRTHDWSLSARIVEEATVPVYLAGGLNPGNVAEAIGTVRPYAVDVCTGVRTVGNLDESKLRRFMAAVRSMD